MTRLILASVLAGCTVLAMQTSALSDGEEDGPYFPFQEDWSCGKSIPLDKQLATEVLEHGPSFGSNGEGIVPPFLLGGVRDSGGSYLFVRQSSGWTTYPLFDMPGPEAVYATPAGAVMIVSWHTVEAPGDHVTAYSDDGFKTIRCGLLPDGAAFPEYWTLTDFNGDGPAARIVGQIMSMEGDLDPPRWSELETSDGGANWSEPTPLDTAPAPLTGSYTRLGAPPAELIEDLRSAL